MVLPPLSAVSCRAFLEAVVESRAITAQYRRDARSLPRGVFVLLQMASCVVSVLVFVKSVCGSTFQFLHSEWIERMLPRSPLLQFQHRQHFYGLKTAHT